MKRYFYGESKSGSYFEGWYFRCQMKDGRSLALIPAFHVGEDGKKRASIQVITEDQSWWIAYPASAFTASQNVLRVRIEKNSFTEDGLLLDAEGEGLRLCGSVGFGPFRSLRSDIMGPFRWLAGMECSHSVISMGHTLQGKLELNGQVLDFDGGMGYIEGDRGHSFPASYLWTQCLWNGGSLMLSVARIPFGGIRFTGCICALIFHDREYRFATYRGAKMAEWSARGAVLRQGKYRLEVQLLEQNAQPLRAPAAGSMCRTVQESLCARVRYRFWRRGVLLFDHTDAHAGFEYGKSPGLENG